MFEGKFEFERSESRTQGTSTYTEKCQAMFRMSEYHAVLAAFVVGMIVGIILVFVFYDT